MRGREDSLGSTVRFGSNRDWVEPAASPAMPLWPESGVIKAMPSRQFVNGRFALIEFPHIVARETHERPVNQSN